MKPSARRGLAAAALLTIAATLTTPATAAPPSPSTGLTGETAAPVTAGLAGESGAPIPSSATGVAASQVPTGRPAGGLPVGGPAPTQPSTSQSLADGLPIGDSDLVETRSSESLGRGVTLTRIVRGTEPAPADQINTTPRGPWVVSVLTIDPRRARGQLQATYGADLARVEKTSELVRGAGAVAGVNASFFTFTANPTYPGEQVGLGIFDGKLLSEPLSDPAEANLLIDAKSNKVLIGHLSWTGKLRNRWTKAELPLEFVNHPPVVPVGEAPGDVVLFTPEFGAATPSGAGVEVVFDRRGCVVRTANTRGTTLTKSQFAVQATGPDTNALLALTTRGCVDRQLAVADQRGRKVQLHKGLYGVTGRYQLTSNGVVVVPPGSGSFFDRNPRTIAGTTRDGKIVLATIDGRQTTSVGTTMTETAAVAKALGLHDSINLDGGGSTAMARADGTLVNHPSGTNGAERAVGDAIVFVPHH
ncbi:phosphodiester glycosidase family protein [Kribbella sp. NBC_01505]|uniref:phosphodiester glycosidase family protein n=1 Tax=Kribbella sp. NBC_01505 TaxID=2903580 RepID=UPI00386A4A9A